MNEWRWYQERHPGEDWPVEWRNAKGQTWVGYARDFRPEFNIDRLAWRHTGISMEMLGGDAFGYPTQQMVTSPVWAGLAGSLGHLGHLTRLA